MSDTHFDVIVLGAGPGGYLAAERLGHAGKKVALVEEQYLGGTCLNVGCIPTKTLLNGAKNYLHAKEASQFGVDAQGVAVNWTQMQAWKDQVVSGLVAGVTSTERKAGVTVINGRGRLDDLLLVVAHEAGLTGQQQAEAPGGRGVELGQGPGQDHDALVRAGPSQEAQDHVLRVQDVGLGPDVVGPVGQDLGVGETGLGGARGHQRHQGPVAGQTPGHHVRHRERLVEVDHPVTVPGGGQGGDVPVAPQDALTPAGVPAPQPAHVLPSPRGQDGGGGEALAGGLGTHTVLRGRGHHADRMPQVT